MHTPRFYNRNFSIVLGYKAVYHVCYTCYFLPKKNSQWLAGQLAECVPIYVLSI